MKTIFSFLAGLILFAGTTTPGIAQLTRTGTPPSELKKFQPVDVPVVELGPVDVSALEAEDRERRSRGKEFDRRFGKTFDVQWNTQNSGIWVSLPDGSRVWQLRIRNEGALSLNLTFSRYFLPEGAELYILGKKNRIGALTQANNQSDRKLGTGLILGDELLLEYFEPAFARGIGEIEVGKATHGYRDPYKVQGWGQSDDCEMNVNCPQGEEWKNEKRSVARIIDNGDVCTGSLVNNQLQDGKPYFLTANHCFSASSTTWVFSFNWESPTCTTPTTPIPENQTLSGSILRARIARSDFCLLELNSKPPASFNVFYSGWSARNIPSQKSVIIHHPSGDIKKITFDFNPATSSGYGVNSANDSSHWRTWNYELNTTTEGGSSGCPMYDQNHRLVGQLHGGPASCTNFSSDFYGKFSMSWNLGTTPATRLRDWLDPLQTGILELDGFDPTCNRIAVNLPWLWNLDTVERNLPFRARLRNPNQDSTFRLVTGGFPNSSGKAFRYNAEEFNPAGRSDTLLLPPLTLSRFKNLKIRFRHAYRRRLPSVSDTLILLVSQDCGTRFRLVGRWSGEGLVTDPATGQTSPFVPSSAQSWMEHEIVLDSTYNRSGNLVFAFGTRSGNAGTLWLDDVSVLGDSAGFRPLARISASQRSGCAGMQVAFADSSLNGVTSRTWLFEGGNPSFSSEANPLISYPQVGVFRVKLLVRNPEGVDSLVEENFIRVQALGQMNTPVMLDFPSGSSIFPPSGFLLLNPESNVTWVRNATVNAPGSSGVGSLMFDNFNNPNVSGQKDALVFPRISTLGKSRLRLRFRYAYKYYQSFGGTVARDSLSIGYAQDCGGMLKPLWKKGGIELATAGAATSIYTPIASDWKTVSLNLDSLLYLPEVALYFQNRFGFGNRIFIDDIFIDTLDNCPGAPILTVNSDTLCSGANLVLAMDSIPGAGYVWTGPGNYQVNTRTATRVVTSASAGIYYASVISNGCTGPSSSVNLTVLPSPGVPTISVFGNVLTGPANMASYLWILNGDTLDFTTRSITAEVSGSYVLVVTNSAGCPRASNPRVVTVTSAQEAIYRDGWVLFPNPASEKVRISGGKDRIMRYSIFNAQGRQLESRPFSDGREFLELNLSSFPEGSYWIHLRGEKKSVVFPVLRK